MSEKDTRQRLACVTDAGLFEKLATAVLREQDPRCRRLSEVGINAAGRTVKSPSDAIGYVSEGGQLRMVAVHHTTCAKRELRRKWLEGPNGDFQKTARMFHEQGSQIGELRATLILTTNKEPSEALVHDVQTAGQGVGVDVEVYTGSGIAHFLDAEPRGQWLRHRYLGVAQTQLSEELLRELSMKSLATAGWPDRQSWIIRKFDKELARHSLGPVTFIVGESGVGKTVACQRWLDDYIQAGGFGLVVTDEALWKSQALADAVDATLRELQPSLAAGAGHQALSFASEGTPLFVVVEDVNRSVWPARLLERLAKWGETALRDAERHRWCVLCPVWPRTMALLNDITQKSVGNSSVWLSCFSEDEGIAAIQRRSAIPLSPLDAEAVAAALGYDPLLIALHDHGESTTEPKSVIHFFVQASLRRLAAGQGQYTAGEYRRTLEWLSLELMERRQLEPTFINVLQWIAEEAGAAEMLREIAGSGEVMRLEGPAELERIVFRHDRVRDYLIADALTRALQEGKVNPSVLSDPYFAEVIGLVLAGGETTTAVVAQIAKVNPLALFTAMRHFRHPQTDVQRHVVDASSAWVQSGAPEDLRKRYLRAAVLRILAECEGAHVIPLCERVDGNREDWWALRARFRNGDTSAGIQLCGQLEPGVHMVGHVELIEHVLSKAGSEVLRTLDKILRKTDLNGTRRSGALRLAGFAGSPLLSHALRESWRVEGERQELLPDYLWACSQCCGDDPPGVLGSILDQWADMPEEADEGRRSPRTALGADHLRWAFRDKVPHGAIGYFLQRAKGPDLRWPMLVMLNGVDNSDAIEFVVEELARLDEEMEGTGRISPFGMTAVNEWGRRPRYGRSPMTAESRKRLQELWSNDDNGRHLRRRALQFWCATVAPGDVDVLSVVDVGSEIVNTALYQRLRRGDQAAIPELMQRLEGDRSGYWWQTGRYLWSDELTECLDRTLERIANEAGDHEGDASENLDWILSERLMELPSEIAERLIEKHWSGLSHSARFVQAALYVASRDLQQRVREVVEQNDKPESLFMHLGSHFGVRVEGRRGVTRVPQMEALLPYLNYLSDLDVLSFWEVCNENGWFDWRREHLDSLVKHARWRFVDGASALKELDEELAREGHLLRVDLWGESVSKAGFSLEEMMELVKDWLERRDEEKALHIAVSLVTRFGRRRHLEVLNSHKAANSMLGQVIIDNASFELRLRSLR